MKRRKKAIFNWGLILLLLLPFAEQAQQKPFRFAQLTDIHLNPHLTRPTLALLESIAQINASDSIDFVLVTGDITDDGDRATMLKVKEYLSLLKPKYYIIPGNHETTWSESGCTAFGEIFGSERFCFNHDGITFLGFNSGPMIRMAYGHVVPEDIRWMCAKMDSLGRTKPVILVTHYPMLEGDVDNWYEVTDAVRPFNVRLFIGGHYHRYENFRYDGIPGILTRSNLPDKDGKPGYGIFDVTADSIIVYDRRIGEARKRRAAFSLSTVYYDHQGKADKYPDYSVNKTYPKAKTLWTARPGGGMYSAPAVEGERVYVGDSKGLLSCYNLKNGKQLWQYPSGRRIFGGPEVSEGVVVFGNVGNAIYGLDAVTGKRLWTVRTSEPVLGAVSIKGDTAYIGASDSTFRAIDIHSGKVRWAYRGVNGYIVTKPLVTADQVIFGAWDDTLYALNRRDGSLLWKWAGGRPGMHYSPASVWPVAAHGKVFITDPARAMTAIDIETGRTVWRTFQSMVRETIGLSADKERIYSKTMQDSVVCYATKGDTPREIWASDVGFGYEHAPSMPLEKDGRVFGSTKEGLVFALDALTGRVIWKHKVGNCLVNTVFPLDARRVLYTSTDGTVGLIKH
jgi:outer membrane protein assembly factor BamB/Icc-related predicted phosphoesterase